MGKSFVIVRLFFVIASKCTSICVAIHNKKIKKKEIGYFMLNRNSVAHNSLACDISPIITLLTITFPTDFLAMRNLAILIASLCALMFALAL